jgi:hypothetical protein
MAAQTLFSWDFRTFFKGKGRAAVFYIFSLFPFLSTDTHRFSQMKTGLIKKIRGYLCSSVDNFFRNLRAWPGDIYFQGGSLE